uniref:Uncharacterized protein n=1 Tax=Eutreptiella gymnastica TaxID=73025 RepID=A0A7S1NN86_9EUGL
MMWAQVFNDPVGTIRRTERALGRHFKDVHELPNLDLVDSTTLDGNVDGNRHSYYNLNTALVGDLRDLIVTSRRAILRHRLRRGLEYRNVFYFMIAPPNVTGDKVGR